MAEDSWQQRWFAGVVAAALQGGCMRGVGGLLSCMGRGSSRSSGRWWRGGSFNPRRLRGGVIAARRRYARRPKQCGEAERVRKRNGGGSGGLGARQPSLPACGGHGARSNGDCGGGLLTVTERHKERRGRGTTERTGEELGAHTDYSIGLETQRRGGIRVLLPWRTRRLGLGKESSRSEEKRRREDRREMRCS